MAKQQKIRIRLKAYDHKALVKALQDRRHRKKK